MVPQTFDSLRVHSIALHSNFSEQQVAIQVLALRLPAQCAFGEPRRDPLRARFRIAFEPNNHGEALSIKHFHPMLEIIVVHDGVASFKIHELAFSSIVPWLYVQSTSIIFCGTEGHYNGKKGLYIMVPTHDTSLTFQVSTDNNRTCYALFAIRFAPGIRK